MYPQRAAPLDGEHKLNGDLQIRPVQGVLLLLLLLLGVEVRLLSAAACGRCWRWSWSAPAC